MSEQNKSPLDKLNEKLDKKKVTYNNAFSDLNKAKSTLQTELSKLGSLSRIATKPGSTDEQRKAYADQETKIKQAENTISTREENLNTISSALKEIEKEIHDIKESASVANLKSVSKTSLDDAAQFFDFLYSVTGATSLDELKADIKSKFTSY
ncbi:hypothetical protein ABEH28_13350 [Pseudomonas sp. Ps21-P2]|uniref:hypothetical protein n=1 Tax=Pseudomonas sp. Ps21-P2 TaxID=3080331 RepID=UPI00320B41CF